jgi:hypothetical protein
VRFAKLLLLLLSLAVGGCGAGDWGTASGTVLLDGKPLTKGRIYFNPTEDGAPALSLVNEGAYAVQTGNKPGLRVGKYIITVLDTTIPPSGETAKLLTPEKYSDIKTSDLVAEVRPGENTFKFELKSAP